MAQAYGRLTFGVRDTRGDLQKWRGGPAPAECHRSWSEQAKRSCAGNSVAHLCASRFPLIFPDQPHANSLLLKNSFPDAVGVKAKLFAPDRWIVEPNELALRLPGGAESQQPFTVTLPPDVLVGRQEIRIEFEIQADRPHHFSIDRHIEVGMGDVGLSGVVQLNERGELEVRQTVVNRGKTPVSFRCQLFVPDRRREASQVIDLDRAADVKVYALANGRELLGKTLWLRAEEVGGDRVLNCRLESANAASQDGELQAVFSSAAMRRFRWSRVPFGLSKIAHADPT